MDRFERSQLKWRRNQGTRKCEDKVRHGGDNECIQWMIQHTLSAPGPRMKHHAITQNAHNVRFFVVCTQRHIILIRICIVPRTQGIDDILVKTCDAHEFRIGSKHILDKKETFAFRFPNALFEH